MSAKASSSVPRLPQPETEGHYSALQYVMWLVAGSEISYLKKCPADYNRHATIGYTLLITCVFAAIAGGYAGYFFSKSIIASLVVALVWGLLVYSIDRSMVVSLKKDPDSTGFKKYVPQLLVRGLLGFLIAFFISIPIELLIFDESISAQIQIDKVSELKTFGKSASGAFNVKQQQDEAKRQRENEKRIQEALNNPPPTEEYRSRQRTLSECRVKEREINQRLGKVRIQKDQFYRKTPSITRYSPDGTPYNAGLNKQSSQWLNYVAKRGEEGVIQKDLRTQQGRCNSAENELLSYVQIWRNEKDKELTDTQKKAQAADKRGEEAISKTDSTSAEYEKTIQNQNGFVRRFVALGNAAGKDRDLLMLLWLVRAIFILVEILPTVVKIFTPPGQYDSAIYQAEKDFREITLRKKTHQLQTDAELEKEELARQQAFRIEREGIVHDDIVKRLGEVQISVANKALKEYEELQNGRSKRDVNGFFVKDS